MSHRDRGWCPDGDRHAHDGTVAADLVCSVAGHGATAVSSSANSVGQARACDDQQAEGRLDRCVWRLGVMRLRGSLSA